MISSDLNLTGTLSRYFTRQYIASFIAIAFMLLTIVYFLEVAELFRRTSGREETGLGIVMWMGLAKLPQTAEVVIPFIVLFAAIFTLWRLSTRHEIEIARASGLSVWQFTAPLLVVVFLFGVANTTAINPMSSKLLYIYKRLETKFIMGSSTMELTGAGLWLRQIDGDGVAVVHATKVDDAQTQSPMPGQVVPPALRLKDDVMVLLFGPNENYLARIDAAGGELQAGKWVFSNAVIRKPPAANGASMPPETLPTYVLPTTLTPSKIEDSLAQPDSLSFWELPAFIDALERTGFSSTRHRQHYHALMAEPLLLVAMVLVAIVFMQRQLRQAQALPLLVGAVVSGVAVFILNNTVLAFGISGGIPTFLAAWAVPVAVTALALTMLLHLEEGG